MQIALLPVRAHPFTDSMDLLLLALPETSVAVQISDISAASRSAASRSRSNNDTVYFSPPARVPASNRDCLLTMPLVRRDGISVITDEALAAKRSV